MLFFVHSTVWNVLFGKAHKLSLELGTCTHSYWHTELSFKILVLDLAMDIQWTWLLKHILLLLGAVMLFWTLTATSSKKWILDCRRLSSLWPLLYGTSCCFMFRRVKCDV